MNHLKKFDENHEIELINLHDTKALEQYPQVEFKDAMAVLHGIDNGQILRGLEVTHKAWSMVGKGVWVSPFRWPVVGTLLGYCYRIFARYRQPISRFICRIFGIKHRPCLSGTCYEE